MQVPCGGCGASSARGPRHRPRAPSAHAPRIETAAGRGMIEPVDPTVRDRLPQSRTRSKRGSARWFAPIGLKQLANLGQLNGVCSLLDLRRDDLYAFTPASAAKRSGQHGPDAQRHGRGAFIGLFPTAAGKWSGSQRRSASLLRRLARLQLISIPLDKVMRFSRGTWNLVGSSRITSVVQDAALRRILATV